MWRSIALCMQMSPIQQGLRDAHPYVRRTAVMGVLKVYHLDESAVRNAGEMCFRLPAVYSGGAGGSAAGCSSTFSSHAMHNRAGSLGMLCISRG